MKKTVIIAIFIVYLASIVLVQIFGVPVTVPPGGAYIDGITITGIQLSNPQEGQNTTIRSAEQADGRIMYGFSFVPGNYTTDEESLKNNPNRVKINYILQPDDASKEYLDYRIDGGVKMVNGEEVKQYYLSQETDEIVFLEKIRIELRLQESRANMDVRDSIIIRAI
jgi:hypothetical protein